MNYLSNNFKYVFFGLIISFFQFIEAQHSIIFVHIGKKFPATVELALYQARLMNPDCPIYMLGNKEAFSKFNPEYSNQNISYINLEDLKMTPEHVAWKKNLALHDWCRYSERLLYLHDFMTQYNEINVFHMEHDNMIYVDLSTILHIFTEKYQGIGFTMDNDGHCVCGFMYIKTKEAMREYAAFAAKTSHINWGDMETPIHFRRAKPHLIAPLPIIPSEYANDRKILESYHKHRAHDKSLFHTNIEFFNSVFDAAALGQYLAGTHVQYAAGFINERCIFNPYHFKYEWKLDNKNRRIPYLIYKGKRYRINNLHVHSKNLAAFSSNIEGAYTLGYLDPKFR
ncbi:MAG: hypothetical protein S4CHLAM20_00590 [Chlamydiia bacterium]|nr:hypothetical protein [Chlamydiia bacterium]